jgi:hypothetical protein
MEQPMMRNEHIVRAHQTPLVAINGDNGNQPWRVIHVNNQAAPGGNGSAADPFTTIAEGNAAATQAWDIVLVDPGALDPAARIAYGGTFSPLAANQYFLGNGDSFPIPTVTCGMKIITDNSGARPLLTNPTGPSIVVSDGLYVNNFDIVGSEVGILGSGNLSSGDRGSHVRNVDIVGTQQSNQTGVYLPNTKGAIDFSDVNITNMTNGGFVVEGGEPVVTFNGNIESDVATNGGFVSPIVAITDTTGGTFDINKPPSSGQILDIGGEGILIARNSADTTINIGNATLVDSVETAILVEDSLAKIRITDSEIDKSTDGAAIRVAGGAPDFQYRGTITNEEGYLLEVTNTVGGIVDLEAPAGSPFVDNGSGIYVDNAAGDVKVRRAVIDSDENGIAVFNSTGNQYFNDIKVNGAGGPGYAGVNLQNNAGTSNFNNLAIKTTNSTGFLAANDAAINVTGNSSVDSTGAPAVSLTNVADANINFTTVKSTNSSAEGVTISKTNGNFNVTGGVTITNPTTHGFRVENSADLEVNVPSLTAVTASGLDGIRLINNNQTSGTPMTFDRVQVSTGDASTGKLGGRGIVVQSNSPLPHGPVTINDGTVNAYGGASLDINNADVNIRLTSAASDSSAGNGLNLVNAKGSVEIGETFVTSPTGNGINVVDNVPGFVADFGTTFVTGIANGAVGVNIVNTIDPAPATITSFDSLLVETLAGTGLLTRNGGIVNFNSPASITATGGPAINLENTTGTTNNVAGSGFTFLDLVSTNSPSNGIRLHNLNSDLRVTGGTTITGASAASVSITDNQTPPGVYDVVFNQLTIANRLNTGVFVEGINGTVQVANLLIDNANGVAGPAVRVQNTTNPGDPTGSGSGVLYINGGSIDGTAGNGVEVANGLASIVNTTIAGSTANAVYLTATSGQQTTVLLQGTTLTGAALNGVRVEASGTGVVNATVLNSLIDAVFDPISVVVGSPTADVNLNASGNFGPLGPPGAGSILLNNLSGGLLSIDQASTADLSTANNGAGVAPLGPITTGGTTPTPPAP